MGRQPSKSTMRRTVLAAGGYFSETRQWVFVHPRYGAEDYPTLEDAYEEALKREPGWDRDIPDGLD